MQEGATSLYYMRSRYYDSATARFLSPDPVFSTHPLEVSPYQYSRANPLSDRAELPVTIPRFRDPAIPSTSLATGVNRTNPLFPYLDYPSVDSGRTSYSKFLEPLRSDADLGRNLLPSAWEEGR
jgi:hypothetical protein